MDKMQELLDDLYLACQPIMLCSHTTSIDGYEILLRSKKLSAFPEKLFLWFIEKEERNARLMAHYFREIKKLMDRHANAKLALNLHPQQLQHASTWEFLDNISFLKGNVSIELTEHYCEFDPTKGATDIQTYISNIKNKGFSLAMDDIESGQNNFELVAKNIQNIHTIKVSLLKFKNIHEDIMFNFLTSWLHFSRHYHLKMIVEGVESETISNKLKNLGMVYQQGYYHGKAQVLC